jgi:Rhodopirellula transposase DDE domain
MTAGDTSRAAASSRCDQPGGVQPGDELLPAPGPQAEAHIAAGQPVISVDGKKKELVGNFSSGGRDYRPVGEPVQTNIYDFKGELGKVTPRSPPTACTTWPPTPARYRWGPTTTPASSRSSRSAAGGTRSGASPTPLPTGC